MTTTNETSSSFHSSTNSNSLSLLDPTDEAIFTAGLEDVTSMNKILHELHHFEDQSILIINKEGIRITSGEKSFQVSANFPADQFQRFKFDHENYEQVTFRFMLRDLIESLNLLRDSPADPSYTDDKHDDSLKTSLYIQYRKKGDPLTLKLENQSNYVIHCDLRAFSLPSDTVFKPLQYADYDDYAVIDLNSKAFYDYVSGLDLVTSDFVHLVLVRGDVPIKLSTKSAHMGEVDLEITSNESTIIEKEIQVSRTSIFSFSYKTIFIRPALEAMRKSLHTKLKCGSNGLLHLEHNIDGPKHQRSSVEYYILCEAKPTDEGFY